MAEIFIKKYVKRMIKNGLKNANCISNWSIMCLDLKFQVAMMFDDCGNCEQTHNFGICIRGEKTPPKPVKMKILKIRLIWSKVGLEPKCLYFL